MNQFNILIDKLGGRKFFLVLFIFLITSLMLLLPVLGFKITISKDDFLSLSKVLLLAYPLSNIGQSLILQSYPKDETAVKEEVASVEDMVGGRKYTLILLMYVFFVAFTLFDLVKPEMYVEFTQWLVGVYFTSNITSKAVDNGLSISLSKKP